MIRKQTVSSRKPEEVNLDEFDALIELLPELYPDVHVVLERVLVNGYALLYRWKGKESAEPTVLMSHYDVVAASPEGWKYPPFEGGIAEGFFSRMSGETNAMCATTVAITMLEGSTGVNVSPARVKAIGNIRISVGRTVQETLAYLKKTIRDEDVEIRIIHQSNPAPVSSTDDEQYSLVKQVIRETYPGSIVTPYVMLGSGS